MSDVTLQDWAESAIPSADDVTINAFDNFDNTHVIKWSVDGQLIGSIFMEEKDDKLYIHSFRLDEEYQQQSVFKSFAGFIPGWGRDNGFNTLVVISANSLMQSLLNQCGFTRGEDPNDYFVDISEEDSPPEQYANARP